MSVEIRTCLFTKRVFPSLRFAESLFHGSRSANLKKAYLPLKDKAVKQDFYKGLDRILGENGAYIIVSSTVL